MTISSPLGWVLAPIRTGTWRSSPTSSAGRFNTRNGRVIQTGDVQYMAAGTGVQHSEFNPSKDAAVHLLQIWIQPDQKGVQPRYAEKSLKDAAAGRLHLVTSKSGREGSIPIHQDADLWLGKLNAGD